MNPQKKPVQNDDELDTTNRPGVHKILDNALVKKLQNQVRELEAKNLRLYADIDNLHKQHALEVQAARKSGKRALAASVVELINTTNLSFTFVPTDADEKFKHYVDTLKTSLKKAQSELDSVGLTVLLPAIGDQFDPLTMQALNATDELLVKQVVSVGYSIDGQVIAPAVVML